VYVSLSRCSRIGGEVEDLVAVPAAPAP